MPPMAADRGWRPRWACPRLPSRPRRWAFGAYFDGVDGLRTRGEMHVRHDGYIGVAPLPGGITNVCVVREMHRRDRASGLSQGMGLEPRPSDDAHVLDSAVAR